MEESDDTEERAVLCPQCVKYSAFTTTYFSEIVDGYILVHWDCYTTEHYRTDATRESNNLYNCVASSDLMEFNWGIGGKALQSDDD